MPYVRDKGVLRSVDFRVVPEGSDEPVFIAAGATAAGRNEIDCRTSRNKFTSVRVYREGGSRTVTGGAAALLRRVRTPPGECDRKCEACCKKVCCKCCSDCSGAHFRFHEETLGVGDHVRLVGVLHIDEVGRRTLRAIPRERPLQKGWTCKYACPVMPVVFWGLMVGDHYEVAAGAGADAVAVDIPVAAHADDQRGINNGGGGKFTQLDHPPATADAQSGAAAPVPTSADVVLGLPLPTPAHAAGGMSYSAVPPAHAAGWPASVAYPLLSSDQPEHRRAAAAAAPEPAAAVAALAVPVIPFDHHLTGASAEREAAWAASHHVLGRTAVVAGRDAAAEAGEALAVDPVPHAADYGTRHGAAGAGAVDGEGVDLDRFAAMVHEQMPHVNDRCTTRLKVVVTWVALVCLAIIVGGQLAVIYGFSAPCPATGATNSTSGGDVATECKQGSKTYVSDTGGFIGALLGYIFGICVLVFWMIFATTKGTKEKMQALKESIPDINSPTVRSGDIVRVVGHVRPAEGAPLLAAPLSGKRVVLHHTFTDHFESDS